MEEPRGHSCQVILTAIPVLLLALWLIGCSSPGVQHTAIEGTIRDIDHWEIEWAGPENSQARDEIVLTDIDEKSKYTGAECCLKYVRDVRHELADKYNLSFAENFPQRGRIEVRIFGWTPSRYTPADTAAQTRRRRGHFHRDYLPENEVHLEVVDGTAKALFSDNDKVVRVELKIVSPSGVSLGEAYLTHDSIKPEFVAKVVHRLLSTGTYNDKSLNVDLQ